MRQRRAAVIAALMCCLVTLWSVPAFAQFTASIQGTIQDSSGAGVAKAQIILANSATGEKKSTTSDPSGNYRFVSLAPGNYKVSVEAAGFSKSEATVTILTEQNVNLPIALTVGSATESIVVSTQAPIVDTADSRTELTLENKGVAQLPIVGRNLVTLVTMAPGASGLGTSASGSPASGVDNYSTEEQVDASANGQGQNNNQYIIDGLDVTSGIRQGVLNLTPQPDSIQETSVQVNTFSVEHSRAAGLQTIFTTKSGTDGFHGSASDWFNYQGMFASQHFVGYPYQPFHSNNMDFAIGGPIVPHHRASSIVRDGTITFVGKRRWFSDICGSAVHLVCPNQLSQYRWITHSADLRAVRGWRSDSAADSRGRIWKRGGWLRHDRRSEWRSVHTADDRSRLRLAPHRSGMALNTSPELIRVSRTSVFTSVSSAHCCKLERHRRCHNSLP